MIIEEKYINELYGNAYCIDPRKLNVGDLIYVKCFGPESLIIFLVVKKTNEGVFLNVIKDNKINEHYWSFEEHDIYNYPQWNIYKYSVMVKQASRNVDRR